MKKIRFLIFLKDVFVLSLTTFGGPQAHLAMFFKILVQKRAYITENELLELNSFCQILPGPASTQTITAVGYKIGNSFLAFLTVIVWLLPAAILMTAAGIAVFYLNIQSPDESFTRYLGPIALGFVLYAVVKTFKLIKKTKTSLSIFLVTTLICLYFPTPWIFPIILLLGGFITSFRPKKDITPTEKQSFKISYGNIVLFGAIFIGAALIGKITDALPVRLFENFFRNGSLVFGGGQALIGYFYTEFVEFKEYLTPSQFLTGYAFLQALPGPVFTFASYIGSISMKEYGLIGMMIGGVIGSIGIFLPGTILIFFIAPIWQYIKQYHFVKASFEGINAGNAGIILGTAIQLILPFINPSQTNYINFGIILTTLLVLIYTKIPHPFIIIAAFVCGFLI
jgi:chromate transporter